VPAPAASSPAPTCPGSEPKGWKQPPEAARIARDAGAGRVRDCLRHVAGVSETKIPGGLAFLAHGHLTVGLHGDGLIARIGAAGHGRSRCRAGRALLGYDGPAMRGVIVVAADVFDDRALDRAGPQLRDRPAADVVVGFASDSRPARPLSM
jgi:hypothetical protein